MAEAARVAKHSHHPQRLARVIPMPDTANGPQAVADFTSRLKTLSNYEVRERVESAITPHVSQEAADTDTWRFRLLLDEFQWRLSGLEGPAAVPEQPGSMPEGTEIH